MQKEIWKDIEGYEGLYQISNYGRLKSLLKNIICKSYTRPNSYVQCDLYKNGIRKHFYMHRLVAEYFVFNPNPEEFNEVNHVDLNKSNNYFSNLEWCTHVHNQKHASDNNKMKGNILYNKNIIDKIREEYILNNKQIDIARRHGISTMQISRIVRNISRLKF